MKVQIRLFVGDTVKSVNMEQERFSIGTDTGCDLPIEQGLTGKLHMEFHKDQDMWSVSCRGPVLLNGHTVDSAIVHQGDFFVLDTANRIAVQLDCYAESSTKYLPLRQTQRIQIGRSQGCTVQLRQQRVSGRHLLLEKQGGCWYAQDCNSTNGTFLNGRALREKTPLCEGDTLLVSCYLLTLQKECLKIEGDAQTIELQQTVREESKKPVVCRPKQGGNYPVFTRSPRLLQQQPADVLTVEPAPLRGAKPEMDWVGVLVPSLGSLGIMAVLTLVTGFSPISLMMSGPMAIIGVLMTIRNYRKQVKRFKQNETSCSVQYGQYLKDCESRLQQAAQRQLMIAQAENPDPVQCFDLVQSLNRNLWVRTPADKDFLALRVGLGEAPPALSLQIPQHGFAQEESEFTEKLNQMAERYSAVKNMPVTAGLKQYSNLGVVANRDEATAMARNLVVQLAAQHSYNEVKLVVLYNKADSAQWSWVRWLPHVFSEDRSCRYIATDRQEIKELLNALSAEFDKRRTKNDSYTKTANALPHYVFLVADRGLLSYLPAEVFNGSLAGISSIQMADSLASLSQNVELILELSGGSGLIYPRTKADEKRKFVPDVVSVDQCERFARAMAPIRLQQISGGTLPDCVTYLQGAGVSRAEDLPIGKNWAEARSEKSLSVPIGMRKNGEKFFFDIHEGQDGPHGLVAGTSGSGKSEMAQSWILSMALQFSPQDVNFILVDFKGTSLLRPFLQLPHLAGSISNLDKDVERCLLALESEMNRRQRMLDAAACGDILSYLKKRRCDEALEPMPFLILVIDEFADFKAQFPDFTQPMNHIFRGGRSLGVYTMIMTQKPSGVVTEQMNSNANFRWCLRVQSESDSREMLGAGDACYITNPGRAYIKVGSMIEQIQPFYSGAEYIPGQAKQPPQVCTVALNGAQKPVKQAKKESGSGQKQIEAVVACIAAYTKENGIAPARKIWNEPLADKIDLLQVLARPNLWGGPDDWQAQQQNASAVIGLVDDPANQKQYPLLHDFWQRGDLLLYGMSLSGKTVFLQSLMLSMCARYSPLQVQFYLAEFGGFGLRSLEQFPHVAGAAGDDEPQVLARIAGALKEELARRKQQFRAMSVGSITSLAQAGKQLPPTIIVLVDNLNLAEEKNSDFSETLSTIVLVDNLNLAEEKNSDFSETLSTIVREGEAFGIYLAAASTGLRGVNYQLSQNIKTKMTLQLADPTDYSMLVGRVKSNIPAANIGRGLCPGPLEFQTAIALPDCSDGQRMAKLQNLAQCMTRQCSGGVSCKIAALPERLAPGSVTGEPLMLGLSHENSRPVCLPVRQLHSLLVSCADVEIKNSLLTDLLQQLQSVPGAQVILYSKTLKPANAQCTGSFEKYEALLEQAAQELRRRKALHDADPEKTFAPLVFAVDDFDGFLQNAPVDSISRLEVFIRLGANLGVTVIGADLAPMMRHASYSNNILVETMQDSPVLLAGGSGEDHQLKTGTDAFLWENFTMRDNDLLLIKDGKICLVRRADS